VRCAKPGSLLGRCAPHVGLHLVPMPAPCALSMTTTSRSRPTTARNAAFAGWEGGAKNYFHCSTCGSCYAANLQVSGGSKAQHGGPQTIARSRNVYDKGPSSGPHAGCCAHWSNEYVFSRSPRWPACLFFAEQPCVCGACHAPKLPRVL